MRHHSLLLPLLLLAACSDSSVDPSGNADHPYQPTSKGSTWVYTGIVPDVVTSLGDTVIDGKTYLLLSNSSGPNNLFRIENGVYTSWPSTTPTPGTATTFLKDNVPVGTTWSFQIGITYYEYRIAEVGISHTVNGQVYNDVIHVHYTSGFLNPSTGQVQVGVETDTYHARGIGTIEVNHGSFGRNILVSYDIK